VAVVVAQPDLRLARPCCESELPHSLLSRCVDSRRSGQRAEITEDLEWRSQVHNLIAKLDV